MIGVWANCSNISRFAYTSLERLVSIIAGAIAGAVLLFAHSTLSEFRRRRFHRRHIFVHSLKSILALRTNQKMLLQAV